MLLIDGNQSTVLYDAPDYMYISSDRPIGGSGKSRRCSDDQISILMPRVQYKNHCIPNEKANAHMDHLTNLTRIVPNNYGCGHDIVVDRVILKRFAGSSHTCWRYRLQFK